MASVNLNNSTIREAAKLRFGSYIVQKAKIRYDCVFSSIENAEIRYCWGSFLLTMFK